MSHASEARAPVGTATTAEEPFRWRVVAYMYTVGCLLSALCALCAANGVAAANGAWLIFSPFGPALAYALWRDYQQQKEGDALIRKQK